MTVVFNLKIAINRDFKIAIFVFHFLVTDFEIAISKNIFFTFWSTINRDFAILKSKFDSNHYLYWLLGRKLIHEESLKTEGPLSHLMVAITFPPPITSPRSLQGR